VLLHKTGQLRTMAYGGFEKDRGTLKYLCPARHYGTDCPIKGQCAVKCIRLEEDRRVFTLIARSSYAWERTYAKRTAVERVNSRLDVSFGLVLRSKALLRRAAFEQHFIRGQQKMELRCGLALIVMLAMAVGGIKEKHKEQIRSLVRAA